jgi:hypothetical protein
MSQRTSQEPGGSLAKLVASLGAIALSVSLSSCRDATQIVLQIRTQMPCSEAASWRGVAVYVGAPGAELEKQSPTLVSTECGADGEVGSLVITPSSSKSDEIGVRVVAGILRKPEDCEANGYEGCVVARRAARFVPHEELRLEVELMQDCLGVACDPENTCYQGVCVRGEQPPEQALPAAPVVRCGDNGVFCPTTGDVCCLTVDATAGSTSGECRRGSMCQGIVLNCDDDSDCPRGGPNNQLAGICALSYTPSPETPFIPSAIALSACHLATMSEINGANGLALCQEHKHCVDGTAQCQRSEGAPNLLPGYFWCQLHCSAAWWAVAIESCRCSAPAAWQKYTRSSTSSSAAVSR